MTQDEVNGRLERACQLRFIADEGDDDYMLIVDGNDLVVGRVQPYASSGNWEFNGREYLTKRAAINAARAEYRAYTWSERDHIEMLKEVLEKQFPDLGQKKR